MLTGLNLAWFKVYSGAVAECSLAQSTRGRTFGILVGDDKWALRYQLADARKDHAERHLVGPPILSDWSSAEGNVTAQSNREWRQRRAEQKRRAKRLLAPIFEREAELDAMGMSPPAKVPAGASIVEVDEMAKEIKVRVRVTEKDIVVGVYGSCFRCPIARAMARVFRTQIHVGSCSFSRAGWYRFLPTEACDFISRFDEGKTVKPFSFTVNVPPSAAAKQPWPRGGRRRGG